MKTVSLISRDNFEMNLNFYVMKIMMCNNDFAAQHCNPGFYQLVLFTLGESGFWPEKNQKISPRVKKTVI